NAVGVPPLNVTVPSAFEKLGSAVQSENTDPSFVTEETESRSLSNVIEPSAAFTLSAPGLIVTLTVKSWFAGNVPLLGENESSAADAKIGVHRNAALKSATERAVWSDRCKRMCAALRLCVRPSPRECEFLTLLIPSAAEAA